MDSKYTREDCIKETMEHISHVRFFMVQFAQELLKRALIHDQSKLESPEVEVFAEYTPKLKDCTYFSDEYKGFLKCMSEALKHHYIHNSHHPEHYENGVCGMDLLDVVEMLCDWKASSMRHNNGDIRNSLLINKDRFEIGDVLTSVFKNTLDKMDW